MESILQTQKGRCFICHRITQTEEHHLISGTSNRKKSEKDGLKIDVCRYCHNTIHTKREVELKLKQLGQRVWEEHYGDRQGFIKRYGKSWII